MSEETYIYKEIVVLLEAMLLGFLDQFRGDVVTKAVKHDVFEKLMFLG